ncbi:MAG TPA: hypothetical protein VIX19_10035 [Terriglobales bacterium]
MYIQYVGFNGTAGSRAYDFHVVDVPREPRNFTVEINSEAFGPSRLRFQDGPDICFARLKEGLQEETSDARAEVHLNISEQDVRVYLEAHRPVKLLGKGRRESLVEEPDGSQGRPSFLTRAPQREIARQKQQDADDRTAQAKARQANQAAFRP